MALSIHSSSLKYRLNFLIFSSTIICLLNSCSKKTTDYTEVVILNHVSGLPEKGEIIQLFEVKEKDLDLTAENPNKYTFIEEKISDNNGKVYFDNLKLKRREKFKYYASWVKKEGISYSNYIHVKDEVVIDKYNERAINDLIIAPSMKKLFTRAINIPNDVIKYKIQRENRHQAIKIAIGLEAFTSFFEYIAEHPVSSIPDFAAALNRWRSEYPEFAHRIPKYNKSKWERNLSISTKGDIEFVF